MRVVTFCYIDMIYDKSDNNCIDNSNWLIVVVLVLLWHRHPQFIFVLE